MVSPAWNVELLIPQNPLSAAIGNERAVNSRPEKQKADLIILTILIIHKITQFRFRIYVYRFRNTFPGLLKF
jgi:hypothetical protein